MFIRQLRPMFILKQTASVFIWDLQRQKPLPWCSDFSLHLILGFTPAQRFCFKNEK